MRDLAKDGHDHGRCHITKWASPVRWLIRVVFMADGKILEEGAPSELFDHPKDPRLQDFLSKVL